MSPVRSRYAPLAKAHYARGMAAFVHRGFVRVGYAFLPVAVVPGDSCELGGGAIADGNVTATYYPFGATGGNVLSTADVSPSKGRRRRSRAIRVGP
jgi:hypothetical protein